jgi:hypothetical protein
MGIKTQLRDKAAFWNKKYDATVTLLRKALQEHEKLNENRLKEIEKYKALRQKKDELNKACEEQLGYINRLNIAWDDQQKTITEHERSAAACKAQLDLSINSLTDYVARKALSTRPAAAASATGMADDARRLAVLKREYNEIIRKL